METEYKKPCKVSCLEHKYHCIKCNTAVSYSPANYSSRLQDIPNYCEFCHTSPKEECMHRYVLKNDTDLECCFCGKQNLNVISSPKEEVMEKIANDWDNQAEDLINGVISPKEEVYRNKKTGELIDCVTLSNGTRYFSSRRLKELKTNEIDLSCQPYIIPKDIILTNEEFDKLYEKLN